MATQIEKLEQEKLDKLREFQAKANEIIMSLGQISLRTKELNTEIKRLEGVKETLEADFEKNSDGLNAILEELEVKYPKGEVNLNEGIVIFDIEEK